MPSEGIPMRDFIKVLPLGLLLPLVIGAASVKPDDAISNISDWAHRFGFEGAAKWLAKGLILVSEKNVYRK